MFTNEINLNTKPLNTIFSTVEKGYLFKVWPYKLPVSLTSLSKEKK